MYNTKSKKKKIFKKNNIIKKFLFLLNNKLKTFNKYYNLKKIVKKTFANK